MSNKAIVLGISDGGLESLTARSRALLDKATFVAGGERHLAFCAHLKVPTLAITNNLKELAERLADELKKPDARPVVLASGDPLFYGIARFLISKLTSSKVEVHPYLSSMQLAFARAGLKWDDAAFVSVHGRPIDNLATLPPDCPKMGVFTDEQNTPARVAGYLISLGWPRASQAWVVENLEGADEKTTEATLEALTSQDFGPLNVVVVERHTVLDPHAAYAFGLDEALFAQRKPEAGLITKTEVRVLSLAKLRLFPGAVVWDIGAATGSVAIEAARLSRGGRVWAVEKNAEDCDNIRENVARFHTPSVLPLHGTAPEALDRIPAGDDPDAVFIGGTAGKMDLILGTCLKRLKPGGSLVLNTVTVQNTAEALDWFEKSGLDWGFLQVQVSRGKAIKTPTQTLHRLDALNPVHIFWGSKALAPN